MGTWEMAGQWQWYFKVQNLCDKHFVGVARYTLAELTESQPVPACGDLKESNKMKNMYTSDGMATKFY